MPLYNFVCSACEKNYEIQMKLAEHAVLKDKMTCQECHGPMYQTVAKLTFALKGAGWFGTTGTHTQGVGYEITQRELDGNLEEEKRAEERYNTALIKGEP